MNDTLRTFLIQHIIITKFPPGPHMRLSINSNVRPINVNMMQSVQLLHQSNMFLSLWGKKPHCHWGFQVWPGSLNICCLLWFGKKYGRKPWSTGWRFGISISMNHLLVPRLQSQRHRHVQWGHNDKQKPIRAPTYECICIPKEIPQRLALRGCFVINFMFAFIITINRSHKRKFCNLGTNSCICTHYNEAIILSQL